MHPALILAGTATVYVRNKRAKDRQLLDAQLGLEGELPQNNML